MRAGFLIIPALVLFFGPGAAGPGSHLAFGDDSCKQPEIAPQVSLLNREVTPALPPESQKPRRVIDPKEVQKQREQEFRQFLSIGKRQCKPLTDQGQQVASAFGLTAHETCAIWLYSYGTYRDINQAVATGRSAKLMEPVVRELLNGLKKLPDFRGKVAHGVNLHPEQAGGFLQGKVVVLPYFVSTSRPREFGEWFNDQLLGVVPFGFDPYKYKSRLHIRSIHGKSIQPFAEFPGEREVLFPPGTRFRVLSKKPNDHEGWEIELEELEP